VKFRFRHIAALIPMLSIIFGCAGKVPKANTSPAKKIEIPTIEIPSFRWDRSRFINLDASHFPDSVSFFLPVSDEEKLDIDNALLVDDVFGWVEECDFSHKSFGVPNGSNVVIIEDISASMGDYVHFTDRLIWGYISTLTDAGGEVSLVRFGNDHERSVDWIVPDSFLNLSPDSIPYPNARGSDLAGAIDEALDLVAERSSSPCAIVLFSDGDFDADELPYTIIERANRYGVSINILMHGKNPKGALARLADKTGGVYLVQPAGGFSPIMVSAIIARSFHISYYPRHTDEDGLLHRISLAFPGDKRFFDEFRAPGKAPRIEIEKPSLFYEEILTLPDELLKTTVIPFDSAGNSELLPEAQAIIEAYIDGLSSLADSVEFTVKIAGYACNLGPTGINIRLSKQRAQVVRDYIEPLTDDNISIEIAWFGEMYPLNENLDETDRRANRRVEIEINLEFAR